MRKFLVSCAAGLLAVGGAATASAATITYSVSGTASGTLGGNNFSGGITITSFADTDSQIECQTPSGSIAGCYTLINDSMTVEIEGLGVATLSGPSISFYNSNVGVVGFSEIIPGDPVVVNTFAFVNSGGDPNLFGPWDGKSDTGTVLTTLTTISFFAPFNATDLGQLTFNAGPPASATFTAALQGAVPEASTWAMMIIGLGLVGAALRRRQAFEAAAFA